MRILVAPNAFKGSLTADEAAKAIVSGFEGSSLQATYILFPVGDGGTGTGGLLANHFSAKQISIEVFDPLKRLIKASYGVIDEGKTAIIDVSSALGIHLLQHADLDPFSTTSFGVGQLIFDALNQNIRKFIIGVGGTSTVDGGAGILQALGAQFYDVSGRRLENIPQELHAVDHVDLSNLDERILESEVILLCDVENPLFGHEGGIRMFSGQKGASIEQIGVLERNLANFSELLCPGSRGSLSHMKYSGAAGGISGGLYLSLQAKLVSGIDYFLEVTECMQVLQQVDAVVTGEGSIDKQTLRGKAPYGVAKLAKSMGLPVIALTGIRPVEISQELNKYFDAIFAIGSGPGALEIAMSQTAVNLYGTAKQMGNLLSSKNNTNV